MKKIFGVLCGVLAGVVGIGSNAMAAVDLTGVTFPVTEFEALAAVILAAIAALWVIKRLLGLPSTR